MGTMKCSASKSLGGLGIVSLLALSASSTALAQSISASEARNHVGERAKVCGKVAGEKTATGSKGQPTFINVDAPYPNQIFTILIWNEDRKSVGELPQLGGRVCATGTIQDYHGVPEIVVRTSAQLSQ
jgi:hypothetical protein